MKTVHHHIFFSDSQIRLKFEITRKKEEKKIYKIAQFSIYYVRLFIHLSDIFANETMIFKCQRAILLRRPWMAPGWFLYADNVKEVMFGSNLLKSSSSSNENCLLWPNFCIRDHVTHRPKYGTRTSLLRAEISSGQTDIKVYSISLFPSHLLKMGAEGKTR